MKTVKQFLLLALLTVTCSSFAADTTRLPSTDTTFVDSSAIDKSKVTGEKVSPRIVSGAGFRLQVIKTRSRTEALKIKGQLLSNYPGSKIYIMYKRPYFRVRLGNFRTTGQAAEFRRRNMAGRKHVYVVKDRITYIWPPS